MFFFFFYRKVEIVSNCYTKSLVIKNLPFHKNFSKVSQHLKLSHCFLCIQFGATEARRAEGATCWKSLFSYFFLNLLKLSQFFYKKSLISMSQKSPNEQKSLINKNLPFQKNSPIFLKFSQLSKLSHFSKMSHLKKKSLFNERKVKWGIS